MNVMPRRTNLQLARIFGIRVGVSYSWFIVLFFLIYYLSKYFHEVLGGSQSTAYAVAVAAALGYFASLILHELGHALAARRLGIPIAGIDLWFFGGLSQMRREPQNAGEELKIAAAGPAVTLGLFAICLLAGTLVASSGRFTDAALATGRTGQLFALAVGALGVAEFASNGSFLALATLMLAFFLYQAAGAAVVQGALGRRIQNVTVGDIMDREPVTIPAEATLLDAQEQFFLRYRWPWFAVVDPAHHFLGVVRQQRIESEIAAGRPALPVIDVLEPDMPVRIGQEAPLETLLGSEGLGRLGAMVAVDSDGVLQGVVTLGQVRQALRPATGAARQAT